MPLERLTDIDWSRIGHAYGPATDVPYLILALTSERESTRQHALDTLFQTIWHQGSIFEASAYAVPFLIELLTVPSVAEKEGILFLLESLSEGASYAEAHQHFETITVEHERADVEERRNERRWNAARQWAIAAHNAVELGTDSYLSLLGHKDPATAAMATYVLAACRRHSEEILLTLHTVLQTEYRTPVRASIISAMSAILKKQNDADVGMRDTNIALLETILADPGESPYIHMTVAVELLRLRGAIAIEQALQQFAQIGTKCKDRLSVYVPWDIGSGSVWAMHRALRPYPHIELAWLLELICLPAFKDTEDFKFIPIYIHDLCRRSRSATRILVPHLVRWLAADDAVLRKGAAHLLPQMGNLKWTVSDAVTALQSHSNEETQRLAASTLEEFHKIEHAMEQQLTRHITTAPCAPTADLLERLAAMLGSRYGRDLQECIAALRCIDHQGGISGDSKPLFQSLLKNEDPLVRVYVARILLTTGEDPQTLIPLLIQELRTAASGFLALETLGNLGSSAALAMPKLKQIIQTDERPLVQPGMTDTWNEMDDAFVTLAKQVLRSIESATQT